MKGKSLKLYEKFIVQSSTANGFAKLCNENESVKKNMLNTYKTLNNKANNDNETSSIKDALGTLNVSYANSLSKNKVPDVDSTNPDSVNQAALIVWRKTEISRMQKEILAPSAEMTVASTSSNSSINKIQSQGVNLSKVPSLTSRTSTLQQSGDIPGAAFTSSTPQPGTATPFDKRLQRLEQYVHKDKEMFVPVIPYKTDLAEISTSSYLISRQSIEELSDETEKLKVREKVKGDYNKMASDDFYKGVPSLQNYYALVRLYGTEGGKYLVNLKEQRRWYEVDADNNNPYNFASTPTTSALISWGRGDPYGRTPYQFTDFVFSKYWNKINNNRLITLRRYAAPMLDNLKFPGMVSSKVSETAGSNTDDMSFPPMATAITYFGGESGNSLNSLLKFTTGFLWEDIKADVWEVQTNNVPDNKSGLGTIFPGAGNLAEILSVVGGSSDREMVQNDGVLPPDPYKDGPYENRIMGPMNRIDSVKKRKPGLAFEWGGLNLVFEYVARPVGGINPKAVLLDIMSNFLVMGSASAVFFGGAHRFMAAPAKYPFIGGKNGMESWYKGDPKGFGSALVDKFVDGGKTLIGDLAGWFGNILKGGSIGDIFNAITSDGGPVMNITQNYMAKKTAGQVPYLQGMKAILTGEPVGEWHITVGNPLNPIAMIGNLICENITVEFNEELGPDDFPTEMKITVKLNHAMARDRDAIESLFNRGMGRIYMLPDYMAGSADYQTAVDQATKERVKVGTAPGRRNAPQYTPGLDNGYLPKKEAQGVPNPLGGSLSIWDRASFSTGISENSAQQFISYDDNMFQSAYRTADWIAQRSI